MSFEENSAATLSVNALSVEYQMRTQEFALTDHADAALVEKFVIECRRNKIEPLIRIEDVHSGKTRSFSVPFGIFIEVAYYKLNARQQAYVAENASTAVADGFLTISSWDSSLWVLSPGLTSDGDIFKEGDSGLTTVWTDKEPPF